MSRTGIVLLVLFVLVEMGFLGWQVLLNRELKREPRSCVGGVYSNSCMLGSGCVGGEEGWGDGPLFLPTSRERTVGWLSERRDRKVKEERMGVCRSWLDVWTGREEIGKGRRK